MFAIGEKVFLDVSDISITRPMKKFMHHYLCPFSIVCPVGTHAYQLKLPYTMLCIYSVFHVVKLLPVLPDSIVGWQVKPPPPPKIVGGEEMYKVEEVINSQLHWGRL
jgi:hypothetical protein